MNMTKDQFITMVGKLAAVETKVDGINRRLDISNGRIATTENKLEVLKQVDIDTLTKVQALTKEERQRDLSKKSMKSWLLNNLSTIVLSLLIAYLLYKLGLK